MAGTAGSSFSGGAGNRLANPARASADAGGQEVVVEILRIMLNIYAIVIMLPSGWLRKYA